MPLGYMYVYMYITRDARHNYIALELSPRAYALALQCNNYMPVYIPCAHVIVITQLLDIGYGVNQ